MDLIDGMLANHRTLRGSLVFMSALLERPCGCGWDDLMSLDLVRLSKERDVFMAALKAHDAFEAVYVERVLSQFDMERGVIAALAEGHRAVADMTRLFSVVAVICDGEHVHRLRTVLERLSEELEAHLSYAENTVIPELRAKLSAAQLHELGRRAGAIPAPRG